MVGGGGGGGEKSQFGREAVRASKQNLDLNSNPLRLSSL